ncbi:MAG TPA: aromatic-ring-hydroxylating dioxygenase subunit beta [Steroidobacteraceae bacterium]|nr:aromatic-ring-hydroxylating dioxygenase subunit beta [Steroidobacteraceae bacterium]
MNATLLLRLEIEDFLYREAALLDQWNLKEWLALFALQTRYEIAPTGDPEASELDPAEALFLVADDRERLEQRVIRLGKPSAHAEYPHSRVRHIYSNVRVISTDGEDIEATANFVTFRTKRNVTATYMGWQKYRLVRHADSFLIRLKRNILDVDSLVPQGKVSLIL